MAAPKRQTVSKKTRFEIFKRDEFMCRYCGETPPNVILEIDHIIPVAEGGLSDEDNLVTACFDCNRGKGPRSLDSVPKSLAEKAADTAEAEAQLRGFAEIMRAKAERIEDDAWRAAAVFHDVFRTDDKSGVVLRRDRFQSVKRFVTQLPVHEVVEAAEIAVAWNCYNEDRCFRYFCGICWKRIRAKEPQVEPASKAWDGSL